MLPLQLGRPLHHPSGPQLEADQQAVSLVCVCTHQDRPFVHRVTLVTVGLNPGKALTEALLFCCVF